MKWVNESKKDFEKYSDQMKAIKADLKMNGNLKKGSKWGQGFRLSKMIEKETRESFPTLLLVSPSEEHLFISITFFTHLSTPIFYKSSEHFTQ